MPNLKDNYVLIIHDDTKHFEVVRKVGDNYSRPGHSHVSSQQNLIDVGFRFEQLDFEFEFKVTRNERTTQLNNLSWRELIDLQCKYNISNKTTLETFLQLILLSEGY